MHLDCAIYSTDLKHGKFLSRNKVWVLKMFFGRFLTLKVFVFFCYLIFANESCYVSCKNESTKMLKECKENKIEFLRGRVSWWIERNLSYFHLLFSFFTQTNITTWVIELVIVQSPIVHIMCNTGQNIK